MMCLVYEIYKDSKLDYMRIYITSNWYNKRAPIKNSFFKDDNISSIQKNGFKSDKFIEAKNGGNASCSIY